MNTILVLIILFGFFFIFVDFFPLRVQCVKRLMSDLHSVFLVVGSSVNTDGIMLLIIYSL